MNVAVLGYGVVGSGVVEVIKRNSESIKQRAGKEIKVKWIVDIRDFKDDPDWNLFTKNADDAFNDSGVDVVVETIGGATIAYEFTKKALKAGKSVVTSNKELVATHGPELLQMAKENGVSYLFEASVGGGIPIIRPLNQCLAANEIHGITGILNGTTNYIFTQMKKEGKSFEEALKEAQQNGYAEQNPTADVEGHDTCRKLAILSSIAFNEFVDYKNIYTEGITKITLTDMKYAEAMDGVIKLIAVSRRIGGKIFTRVSPAIISKEHPLANVEDVFNAIVVKGDAIGDAMFYGRGAGKLPTASAVVADIIDIAKHPDFGTPNVWVREQNNNVLNVEDSETKYLVRVKTSNTDAARKEISSIFGQVTYVELSRENELAFVTYKAPERKLGSNLEKLASAGTIVEIINKIRIVED